MALPGVLVVVDQCLATQALAAQEIRHLLLRLREIMAAAITRAPLMVAGVVVEHQQLVLMEPHQPAEMVEPEQPQVFPALL